MILKIKSDLFNLLLLCLTIGSFVSSTTIFASNEERLLISYVTSHLNGLENAVVGVLITPDGSKYVTTPLGPIGFFNITADDLNQ